MLLSCTVLAIVKNFCENHAAFGFTSEPRTGEVLKIEQQCVIGLKTRGVAESFKPNKTHAASFLNSFKNVCDRSTHL